MNRFLSKKSKWLVLSYCFIFRKNRRKNTFKAAHHDKQLTDKRRMENHSVAVSAVASNGITVKAISIGG